MRILTVGLSIDKSMADSTRFSSRTSFLDYDLVICNFSNVLSGYQRYLEKPIYMGLPCLDDDSSARLNDDMPRRQSEMMNLLKLGRMLVIFTTPPICCYTATGEHQSSGLGKTARINRLVSKTNILYCLPVLVSTKAASGESIEFVGNDLFKPFWETNKSLFRYDAYFEGEINNPICVIKGSGLAVGYYQKVDDGHLLFLPKLRKNSPEANKIANKKFLESLQQLYLRLNDEIKEFELSTWTKKYFVPTEKINNEQLSTLENDLERIQNRISDQKMDLLDLQRKKIALCGSGKPLERVVQTILKDIGFSINETLPNRDDFIISYKEKVSVVEVKGVSKSAAESHAAQLEKWVSEYYSAKNVRPKGILIVNAYKDIPLIERKDPTFPNQMLDYSIHRDHCLISSLQLLGLYYSIIHNPSKKDELIMKLFDTKGEFTDFKDWSQFIEYNIS